MNHMGGILKGTPHRAYRSGSLPHPLIGGPSPVYAMWAFKLVSVQAREMDPHDVPLWEGFHMDPHQLVIDRTLPKELT